jgi:hypothetical protein
MGLLVKQTMLAKEMSYNAQDNNNNIHCTKPL